MAAWRVAIAANTKSRGTVVTSPQGDARYPAKTARTPHHPKSTPPSTAAAEAGNTKDTPETIWKDWALMLRPATAADTRTHPTSLRGRLHVPRGSMSSFMETESLESSLPPTPAHNPGGFPYSPMILTRTRLGRRPSNSP